ncbi:MAG: GHKL domain-containing protein [Defluviitaleaceae bacterium]|nr:GHKL domain-containing protein [Defluviitaleaceae bacterium]
MHILIFLLESFVFSYVLNLLLKKLSIIDMENLHYSILLFVNVPTLLFVKFLTNLYIPLSTVAMRIYNLPSVAIIVIPTTILLCIFSRRFVRSIFSVMVLFFILFISEAISLILIGIFIEGFFRVVFSISIYTYRNLIAVIPSMLISLKLVQKFNKFFDGKENIYDNKITLLVVANMYFIFLFGRIDGGPFLFLVYILLNIVIIIFLMLGMIKENEIKNKLLLDETTKIYIKNLEETLQSLKIVKHDYINILASLKTFIDTEDYKGLTKYFSKELTELNKSIINDNRIVNDLYNIKINEIKGILLYKCNIAVMKNIVVNIEVREPIENIYFSTAKLCQILGIFLDNAIEAINDTSKKELHIAFIKDENSTVIVIKNSWNYRKMSIKQIFEDGFSTKSGNEGIGLSTVNKYITETKNIALDTYLEEGYFTQVFTIHLKY